MDREIAPPPGTDAAPPEDPTLVEPIPVVPEVDPEERDPTMVLPVPAALAPAAGPGPATPRRAYGIIAGVIALLLVVSAAASSTGGSAAPEPTPTTAPTTMTTLPPTTTTAPPAPERGEGHGKGKGHKGGDDD